MKRWGIDVFASKWEDPEGDWVEFDVAEADKAEAVETARAETLLEHGAYDPSASAKWIGFGRKRAIEDCIAVLPHESACNSNRLGTACNCSRRQSAAALRGLLADENITDLTAPCASCGHERGWHGSTDGCESPVESNDPDGLECECPRFTGTSVEDIHSVHCVCDECRAYSNQYGDDSPKQQARDAGDYRGRPSRGSWR